MTAATLCRTVVLAFLFSTAIFMYILSCALYDNYIPLVSLLAYAIAPIPLCLFKRAGGGDGMFDSANKAALHWAEFTTMFLLSVIVGLPFVLTHTKTIALGAALLDFSGFLLICLTGGLAVYFAKGDDTDSWLGGGL